MSDRKNLFGLDDLPAPVSAPVAVEPGFDGDQTEMFERWETLGLKSLFGPSTPKPPKGTVHVNHTTN